MVRMYGELPDVGDPVYQLDTYKPNGRVPDDKDQHRLAKVVLGVVVGERTYTY